jgi:hypothetical protein
MPFMELHRDGIPVLSRCLCSSSPSTRPVPSLPSGLAERIDIGGIFGPSSRALVAEECFPSNERYDS